MLSTEPAPPPPPPVLIPCKYCRRPPSSPRRRPAVYRRLMTRTGGTIRRRVSRSVTTGRRTLPVRADFTLIIVIIIMIIKVTVLGDVATRIPNRYGCVSPCPRARLVRACPGGGVFPVRRFPSLSFSRFVVFPVRRFPRFPARARSNRSRTNIGNAPSSTVNHDKNSNGQDLLRITRQYFFFSHYEITTM